MSFGMNSLAPLAIRKQFRRPHMHGSVTCFTKSRLVFDSRIEFLPVPHGPGLRLEAIFLRRATMIITITTNRTPAMMRIVVGSIEALSLKYMRHEFRYGLCRILPNWELPLKTERATQKYFENRQAARGNQMIGDGCITSVPLPSC